MRRIERSLPAIIGLLLVLLLAANATARNDQPKADNLDILHYKIEAEVQPDAHTLKATTAVTFKITKPTQSAVFELNGSLKVSKVSTPDNHDLQFVQDTLDALNVRVDLGALTPAGQEMTLIFQYEGQLVSSQGGVLANKRLAYIGNEGSYLTYASRWFPFHGYAADTATYEISLITPADLTVVGLSTEEAQHQPYSSTSAPASQEQKTPTEDKPESGKPSKRHSGAKGAKTANIPNGMLSPIAYVVPVRQQASAGARTIHTFVSKVAVLPGTFAIARYTAKTVQGNGVSMEVYVKPGDEATAQKYAEEMSNAVNYYAGKFGSYPFGNKLIVAEIDNESLDTYTTAGVSLFAEKIFKDQRDTPSEQLYREVAFQWWGQSVILKSFDDAWLSQGLSQYSAMLLQESQMPASVFSELARGAMERALAFESQTSIARAPVELDDQSEAYRSIVYYKGAFVFRMLRLVVGDEKFDSLLKSYYEQYRGQQASIDNFEAIATKVAGRDMRYFFGQWVDSTGVPEFKTDYQMIRTKEGAFKVRGTLKQELEAFNMPVDVQLIYEGGNEITQVNLAGKTADFSFDAKEKPIDVVVDPESKLLKISDNIRVSVIVRRGIEHFHSEEYPEAEQQFLAAIKLNRSSSWAWYNLGLLYFAQKNFQKANDTFSEALELDLQPRWVEVWSLIKRGNCYDALGQRERAVAEYNKAIQLGDNYDHAQEIAQQFLSAPFRRNQTDQASKAE